MAIREIITILEAQVSVNRGLAWRQDKTVPGERILGGLKRPGIFYFNYFELFSIA